MQPLLECIYRVKRKDMSSHQVWLLLCWHHPFSSGRADWSIHNLEQLCIYLLANYFQTLHCIGGGGEKKKSILNIWPNLESALDIPLCSHAQQRSTCFPQSTLNLPEVQKLITDVQKTTKK